ncbi:MAG TPA: purine-nucleoside phosphorylase [Bacteroidales bacterium]|jgi:purine-nucleoside phosphorylase|nr:purine-nucleoside phosphorylase [Bacteroidales bacterium]
MNQITQILETASFLQAKGITAPSTGIVLGTGLGNLAKLIDKEVIIDYAEIPHFPLSTVESHQGKLIYGTLAGEKVLAMQGRFHYYEGYTMQQIVFPVRVMNTLGIKRLLLSNAAGALNPQFRKGELMLIDDHINLLPANPLTGKNHEQLGPRFPDMSCPYSPALNNLISKQAHANNILIHKGVYAAVPGPNLETRAEYRYLRLIGADVVGMSTVPEVIACNHMGLPCAAISVLTDECDPDNLVPADIADILHTAGLAEENLNRLIHAVLNELSAENLLTE